MNELEKKLELKFEEFAKNLTIKDIDFSEKLVNLDEGCQLPKKYTEYFDKENEVYLFIKKHIYEYKWDIINETIRIKDCWNCTKDYELESGLYNTDELYLNALGIFE